MIGLLLVLLSQLRLLFRSFDVQVMAALTMASIPSESDVLSLFRRDALEKFNDFAHQLIAKQANDYDMEHKAARARVRAERRCGEILRDMEKATGGQPYQSNGSTSREPPPTLADMGLTKDQSSKWQRLAEPLTGTG